MEVLCNNKNADKEIRWFQICTGKIFTQPKVNFSEDHIHLPCQVINTILTHKKKLIQEEEKKR